MHAEVTAVEPDHSGTFVDGSGYRYCSVEGWPIGIDGKFGAIRNRGEIAGQPKRWNARLYLLHGGWLRSRLGSRWRRMAGENREQGGISRNAMWIRH
jgi:hypothetical protein